MASGDNSLDLHIRTTSDPSGAQAAQQSIKALADETERYQQALQRMASKQEDEDLLSKSANLKRTLSEKAAKAKEYESTWSGLLAEKDREEAEAAVYAAEAHKEVEGSVVRVTAAQAAAILGDEAAAETTTKLISRKQELKEILKGLQTQFPELAAIARMALNPITLASAAIAAAWGLWKTRIEQATAALANVELPDTKAMEPGHINALAAAWSEYAVSVAKANEERATAAAGLSTTIEKLKEELELIKQVTDAEAKAEEARIKVQEARKELTAPQAQAERLETQDQAAEAKMNAEIEAAQKQMDAKWEVAAAQAWEARNKARSAASIRVASEQDDAGTEAELKARAEAAEKEIATRRKRIGDLREREGWGPGRQTWSPENIPFYMRYGGMTGEEAIGMEQQGVDTAMVNVNRYREFMKRRQGRGQARELRKDLYSEAAKAQVGVDDFLDEAPDLQSSIDARRGASEHTGLLGNLARARETLAEGTKAAAEVSKDIASQIKARGAADRALISALGEQRAFNEELLTRIKELEEQLKRHR